MILSAALRYKLLNPRILTDDTNFRNIARTQGIDPIAWDKFIAERGGVAIRGQTNMLEEDDNSEASDINVTAAGNPADFQISDVKEIAPANQREMTVEKLYSMPLLYAVKKFGLNSQELSLLLTHKMKTCGDLSKTDELQIKGFYKKKKAFMANHVLEVRKKIKAEAEKLSIASEPNES